MKTLSTHNSDRSGVASGFLYVPDLAISDPCYNISQEYIPYNVTKQANLPPTDFTLVAIAPVCSFLPFIFTLWAPYLKSEFEHDTGFRKQTWKLEEP